jgi:acyl phosphate:glycerol-3-phosphate acyltransferase
MDTGSMLAAAASIVAAYLIGAIPFGVVVARVIGGPDPRTVGSGRTGGANTLRALGAAPALAAGLLDTVKGCVAVLIPIALGMGLLVQVICALVAILGHSRSVYIGFGGGRGVAPGFGTALVIQPWVAVLMLPVYLAVLATTRYSSLGSLAASAVGGVALTAFAVANRMPAEYVAYAIGAPSLIWLFHADNIQRLIAGQERKIEFRR